MAFFYISFSQNVSIINSILKCEFPVFIYFFVHFIKAQTAKHDARNTNITGLIPAKFTWTDFNTLWRNMKLREWGKCHDTYVQNLNALKKT